MKLSLWQKILKAVGLYKAPARPERKPEAAAPRSDARPPKSNTRNARSGEGEAESASRAPREKRAEGDRPARAPREGAPREGGRPRGGDPKTVESTRVYVGNLSYDVTEQDLQELFKGIGGVRNVEVVYNRSTHRSKGYGFVEMLRMDEAIRAVEVLHDQHFMGRKMTVSGAKSKGQDEREEKEERPEREPKPIVLASTAPAVSVATAPVEAAVAAPVEQPAAEIEAPVAAEAAPLVVEAPVAEDAPEIVAEAQAASEPEVKTEEKAPEA